MASLCCLSCLSFCHVCHSVMFVILSCLSFSCLSRGSNLFRLSRLSCLSCLSRVSCLSRLSCFFRLSCLSCLYRFSCLSCFFFLLFGHFCRIISCIIHDLMFKLFVKICKNSYLFNLRFLIICLSWNLPHNPGQLRFNLPTLNFFHIFLLVIVYLGV